MAEQPWNSPKLSDYDQFMAWIDEARSKLHPIQQAELNLLDEIDLAKFTGTLDLMTLQSKVAAVTVARLVHSREFKKLLRKQIRFPHLFRENFPKRKERSMKGK